MQLFAKINTLASQVGDGMTYFCTEETRKNLVKIAGRTKPGSEIKSFYFDDWAHLSGLPELIQSDHLILVISARRGTLSYQNSFQGLPDKLPLVFENRNLILIYPEQSKKITAALNLEGMDILNVQEKINQISRLAGFIKRLFRV
jgi:hypothetical protein